MRKAILIIIITSLLLCSCQILIPLVKEQDQSITTFIPDNNDTLTIMNWNIQTFGRSKWNKTGIRERILDIVPRADIVFIQEIRDKSEDVFRDLCSQLNKTHNCNISSRAGRSRSKEQYGIVYKKDIDMISFTDFNPDEQDRWERPPIRIIFNSSRYILITYNIHTKPEDTSIEIRRLENITSKQGNVIILGDLNADCYYYNPELEDDFIEWDWVIKDTDDTTTSESECAYDRIIINNDMKEDYVRYGIYKNITRDVSDHYPVWVEVREW